MNPRMMGVQFSITEGMRVLGEVFVESNVSCIEQVIYSSFNKFPFIYVYSTDIGCLAQ